MNKHAWHLDIPAINLSLQLTHNLSFLNGTGFCIARWVSIEMNWPTIYFFLKKHAFNMGNLFNIPLGAKYVFPLLILLTVGLAGYLADFHFIKSQSAYQLYQS